MFWMLLLMWRLDIVKFGILLFVLLDNRYSMLFLLILVIFVKLVGLLIGVKLNLKLFVWIIWFWGVFIIMLYEFGILWVVWKKDIDVFLNLIMLFFWIL